jgi:hypothetical protein
MFNLTRIDLYNQLIDVLKTGVVIKREIRERKFITRTEA